MDYVNSGNSRRKFLSSVGCAGLLAITGCSRTPNSKTQKKIAKTPGTLALYPKLADEQFPIPAITSDRLKRQFWRHLVPYETAEKPGTVLVDTRNFYLYHVERDGLAMRYGVGLGRQGFEWSGRGKIAWKRKWPRWTPPDEMIEREPELEPFSAANGGMDPGLDNPLGARALYIFQGKKDTLYRLHGSPEVSSIGRAVSSGCVRLVNHDIIHLYDRVKSGSSLVVF